MPKLISVGQLIDHSWEHYHKNFTHLMSISAWLFLPTLLSVIAIAIYPSYESLMSVEPLNGLETFAVILWTVTTYILFPIVGTWIMIALFKLIDAEHNKKKIELQKLAQSSWLLFWPVVLVLVLVGLVIVGAMLFAAPGVLLNFLAIAINNSPLAILSGVLMIVGLFFSVYFGFRWLVHYALAQYAVILENIRGRAALTRSRQLIRGRFWSAFFRLAIPKAIFMLIALAIEFILLKAAEIAIVTSGAINVETMIRVSGIVGILITIVAAVLINPILLIADYLLYDNLKDTMTKKR